MILKFVAKITHEIKMNFENLLNENVEWEAAMALAEEVATKHIKHSLHGLINEIHGNIRVFFILKPLKNNQLKALQSISTNIIDHKSNVTKRKIDGIEALSEKSIKKFKRENTKGIKTNDVAACSTSISSKKRKSAENLEQIGHDGIGSKKSKIHEK